MMKRLIVEALTAYALTTMQHEMDKMTKGQNILDRFKKSCTTRLQEGMGEKQRLLEACKLIVFNLPQDLKSFSG